MSYSNLEKVFSRVEESIVEYSTTVVPLRFIIDAQLPKRLSDLLRIKGFDSIHTLDMPNKNTTSDNYIKNLAVLENRVLITKDDDFLQSYILEKKPKKLILVKTGNIRNNDLLKIFESGIDVIRLLLQKHNMLEITMDEIIVHG